MKVVRGGEIELDKNEVIVALDMSCDGWIISQSDHLYQNDAFDGNSTSDNGFDQVWDKGLGVGMYLLELKSWAYKDTQIGEYECGWDVVKVTTLMNMETLAYEIEHEDLIEDLIAEAQGAD